MIVPFCYFFFSKNSKWIGWRFFKKINKTATIITIWKWWWHCFSFANNAHDCCKGEKKNIWKREKERKGKFGLTARLKQFRVATWIVPRIPSSIRYRNWLSICSFNSLSLYHCLSWIGTAESCFLPPSLGLYRATSFFLAFYIEICQIIWLPMAKDIFSNDFHPSCWPFHWRTQHAKRKLIELCWKKGARLPMSCSLCKHLF